MEYLLELNHITKRFGSLVANDDVTIKVQKGSIHSIVGENGAGKSTLMNIAYGLLRHDEGEIIFAGQNVSFDSPLDAIHAGMGMIHQHFMLIPTMTVLDNIIIGYEIGNLKLNRKQSMEELKPYFKSFGLPEALFNRKMADLPVGIQQKIEIIKALYRKAELLIFDEPTASLTPQEIVEFFVLVRNLNNEGKTIIFISHKLSEIMEISDEISIMRAGRLIGNVQKSEITEGDLAKLMIGRELQEKKVKYQPNDNQLIIEVRDLCTKYVLGSTPLKNLSFGVKEGEIFGIAGVAGNGQTELVNILVGTKKAESGQVLIEGTDITNLPAHKRTDSMSYVPEDRQAEGLVMPYTIFENLILGRVDLPQFLNKKFLLNFKAIKKNANDAVRDYSIRVSGGIGDPVTALSGGNQQKVIVAREISRDDRIILAVNPTRGIDIGSIEYIHSCLLDERKKGKTILLVSNELSEIMALSDRIGVIHDGEIVKVLKNESLTKEEVGFFMLGGKGDYQEGGENQ
jgi:simple sugar transport system ATP-binding protein